MQKPQSDKESPSALDRAMLKAGEVVDLISTLPEAAIGEIMSRICRLDIEEHERQRIINARHEAGHALVLLLEDVEIMAILISNLRLSTIMKISRVLNNGAVAGTVVLSAMPEQQGAIITTFLAGLAATMGEYPSEKEKFLSEFIKIEESTWSDMSGSFEAVKKRIEELTGQKVEKKEDVIKSSVCLRRILDQLIEVFNQPKFIQCRNAIGNFILANGKVKKVKKGAKVNETLRDVLAASDITEEDMDQMRRIMRSVDIDGIIREIFH